MAIRQECYKIVYNDRNETQRQIHKRLFDATINRNKLSKQLFVYFYKLVPKIKRQKTDEAALFVIMHDIDKSKKVINAEIRNNESEVKKHIFDEKKPDSEININRTNGKWFYVCSKHGDCAKDHLDYQGRIYYDDKAPQEIIDYAYERNMNSLQYITGKPVWLVTRPYCRHYFVAYTLDDLLHGTYKVPNRMIGDYNLQTPAKANLEYWEDQLAIAEKLNPKPQEWIDKCKIMIRKWKKEI